MRKLIYLLVFFGMLCCQRDKDITPKEFEVLEGKWERTGYQTRENGNTVWMADSINGKPDRIFRADGVPLDENGEGMCCAPQNYLLNGKLFPVEPKSPVKLADYCALLDCAYCETVELQVTDSTLLWIDCGGHQTTYRKLP